MTTQRVPHNYLLPSLTFATITLWQTQAIGAPAEPTPPENGAPEEGIPATNPETSTVTEVQPGADTTTPLEEPAEPAEPAEADTTAPAAVPLLLDPPPETPSVDEGNIPETEVAEEVAEEAPTRKWHDDVSFGAFVDAYGSFNGNLPSSNTGTNQFRAFDANNGFALAWAGADIEYDGDKAGATLALRFGPAANAGWADDAIPGIQHIKQAFATWKATEKLTLDFGRFDTIYGAEVAESWNNHNYSRGMLYNLAQPFWHTGIRAGVQFTDTWGANAMVVNGWGHIVDNNVAKTGGLQLTVTPGEIFGLYVGYLGGPENPDHDPETNDRVKEANRTMRHLADVVVTLDWTKLSVAFNADYIYDDAPAVYGGDSQWWGGMGSVRYAFVDMFAMALRGELLGDPDGWMTGADALLTSATLTLDTRPVEHLILRLEGRYDGSNQHLFPHSYQKLSKHQGTVTLGVVVSSF